jgi:RNA polymerase sigma-70 factor, ECF subfamily
MNNDSELIDRYKNGDMLAFGELVQRYKQPLLQYLGVHSQSHDIIQETFQKVHEKINLYHEGSPFKAWLYKIARNCQIDTSRKEQRRLDKLNDYIATCDLNERPQEPSAAMAQTELISTVQSAVHELSQMQREVLIMNYFHGLSYSEISGILGCSVSSVKTHMTRAIMNLARTLPEKGV